jgi:hypothetical protein
MDNSDIGDELQRRSAKYAVLHRRHATGCTTARGFVRAHQTG